MQKLPLVILVMLAVVIAPGPIVAQNDNVITVEFISVPTGAEVRLDGTVMGITPLTLDIAPGVYDVSVMLPGFRAWSDRVMLAVPRMRTELGAMDGVATLSTAPETVQPL